MKKKQKTTTKFDVEKDVELSDLTKEILSNEISKFDEYQAWKNFFVRYIDPDVVHRKKDIKEFERKLGADFFEILYTIHLIVYLVANKFIIQIQVPDKFNVSEVIFENVFKNFSEESKNKIDKKIGDLFIQLCKENLHAYDLFENIYRTISPREIRKPLGEYFTPLSLAEKMVSEVDKKYSDERWLDNSSGFGVFLFAYLDKFGIKNIEKFSCIDVNPLSVYVTKVAILLEYRTQLNKIADLKIYWGDVLLNERYEFRDGKILVSGNFSELQSNVGVVIGNPPWVSWKSMTKEYQKLIGDDWRSYDIFEKNITRKTLGACNDDLSSYFVYFSIDKFLKKQGLLKYVINLSLFKSNLAGKEFRKFNIQKTNTPFRIEKIYDLSNYKVFPGIANSYCVFDATKGEKTIFPVPYSIINGKKGKEIESTIETGARPVNNQDNGALITINGNDQQFDSIEGICEYKARAGVCTWLNSVYWIRKIEDAGELTLVSNLGTIGKKKVAEIENKIEKDLIFRLLRARNLNDFNPVIENYIIVPQQKDEMSKPIDEKEMKAKYKNTFVFFKNFENELIERSGYKKFLKGQPFYGLYNIGPYTTAPIKLGWQFVSKKFQVYLIDNAEDIIPDLNVMFIPLEDINEAYYLHALLNSKYATKKIESSSNWTFPSGSIQKIYLEKYNSKDDLHTSISSLQQKILSQKIIGLEEEMEKLFKEYWFNGRKKKREITQIQLSFV